VTLAASISSAVQIKHPHHRASCVAAVGIDDRGGKHPLALIAGATENAACGAGADRKSLIAHGFDAALLQPFIIDGSKRSPRPSVAQPHAGPALPGFGRQVIARRCAPHRCINSIEVADVDETEKLIPDRSCTVNYLQE
jgi:hypothetical protein